ncbi:hypothetical protein GCM10020221_30220 [Streptomyces thioluteus]|uniref:Xylan 1,4-beta-xylosidase n=1 Tax=Streptomyces thioluteus TaxID=66431 RepID=A0ABN3X222_STRTU
MTALLAVLACALGLLFTVDLGGGGRSRGGSAHDRRAAVGWGFTHTKYSADRGEDGARRTAAGLLSADPMPQNQHIMGWGADNPEPRPGSYNFTDLDRRVALMRRTGAAPVLTLCCAPDWMKGGGERTDWSQKSLEKAPQRAHYKDFARLAGVVAKRYPDVHHFIVWNELKVSTTIRASGGTTRGTPSSTTSSTRSSTDSATTFSSAGRTSSWTATRRGPRPTRRPCRALGEWSTSAPSTRSPTGTGTRPVPTSSSSTAPATPGTAACSSPTSSAPRRSSPTSRPG